MHKVMMRKAVGLRPPRIHNLEIGTIIIVKPFIYRGYEGQPCDGGFYIVIGGKYPLVNICDGTQIHWGALDDLKWELAPADSEIVIRVSPRKHRFKMRNVLTKQKLPTEVPTAALAARPTASSV